jgi:hypothetical protein
MSDNTIDLIRHVNPLPVDLPAPAIEPLLERLDDEAIGGRATERRPRPRVSAGGVLAAVLATVIAVAAPGAAILLLGHGHSREAALSNPASPPPVFAEARPLMSILGVLRRPQTAADRNQPLIQQLQREERRRYDLAFNGRPVLSLMRLATVAPWGQPIFVVPFLPPTSQAKQRLPRKYRDVTVPTQPALWTFPINHGNGGPGIPAEIEGGRDITNMAWVQGATRGPAVSRWVMVVPDGVEKVALWEATGSTSQHPRPPTRPGSKPILVTVQNNIAAFVAPGFHGPGQEIWYAPGGRVVKRIVNASACGPPLGKCA